MLLFSQNNKTVRSDGGNRKARFVRTGPEYRMMPLQDHPGI
jgi:hypothetical protein